MNANEPGEGHTPDQHRHAHEGLPAGDPSRGAARDSARDSARDLAQDAARDAAQDVAQDAARFEPPQWLQPRVNELVRQGYDEAGVLAMVAPELARLQLGALATPELTRHVAEQFLVQPGLAGVLARLIQGVPPR